MFPVCPCHVSLAWSASCSCCRLAVLLPAACCPWSSLCAWRSSAALCCQLFAALPRVAAAAACASWRLLSFHCPTLSWLLALAAVLSALALLRPAVHSVLLFVCLACSLIALPLLHVHAAALAHCSALMSAHLRLCPAFLCRLPRCVAACCLRSVRRPLPRWFVVPFCVPLPCRLPCAEGRSAPSSAFVCAAICWPMLLLLSSTATGRPAIPYAGSHCMFASPWRARAWTLPLVVRGAPPAPRQAVVCCALFAWRLSWSRRWLINGTALCGDRLVGTGTYSVA